MQYLLAFVISLAMVSQTFADEGPFFYKPFVMDYMDCIGCGDKVKQDSFTACANLRPQKDADRMKYCQKVLIGEDSYDKNSHLRYYCKNPSLVSQVYECLWPGGYLYYYTYDEQAAMVQFRNCMYQSYNQHCRGPPASPENFNMPGASAFAGSWGR